MNALVFALITTASVLSFASQSAAQDIPEVLQGMRLLPNYRLQPLQGIDSMVGQISKPNGLTIRYEIGRIPRAGRPKMGGDFSDQPLLIPAGRREWYKEQTIRGEPVHLAYTKEKQLLVSYPNRGINFAIAATTQEQFAEALLIVLTVPDTPEGSAP